MDKIREDRVKELTKVFADPMEFLKFVRIQEPGELALKYELWGHLVDFYHQLETEKLIDLIKAKQIGISWALAIHAVRKIYTIPGWNVLEFSKGDKEAQALLAKSKIVYNNLPEWMKIYTLEPNSTEKFGFKEMQSKIVTYPSTESAGIGETAGLVIHDESEFHDFYEVNLSHTRATVADSIDRQLISVSTVDKTKPDSYFKRHWKEAEAGRNGFKALFYPYNARPDRGEAFYQEMVKENEFTSWVVEGNYPRSAKEALSPLSAQSCFNKDRLDRLWEMRIDPEVRQGFIYILCPPVVGTQYVAGIDVGEGVGLDYSVLTIVGKQGLMSEVAAVIYTNTVGTDSFAFECDSLCREYFKPLLVIDNIGIGRAVSDKLLELGYPKLYYMGKEEHKKVGWALTRPNKRELAVKLVERINNGSLITRFKPMIKELMEYQWINGHPEPTGKTHGDLIISLMLAGAVLDRVGGSQKASMYVGGKKIW